MQPTQLPVTGEVTTPVRVLRDAALYLRRHGWCQGAYYDATGGSFTPPACVVGAIGMVCYGGPVDAPALNHDDPGFGDFEQALAWLDQFIADRYPARQYYDGFGCAYEFNDARDRTAEQVVAVLNAAADHWDAVHRSMSIPHADYPHEPGTLYDCPACEADCFCADGFVCVRCAIEAESTPDIPGGVA